MRVIRVGENGEDKVCFDLSKVVSITKADDAHNCVALAVDIGGYGLVVNRNEILKHMPHWKQQIEELLK